MTGIAEQLLGSSRAAILATLLLRPDETVHGRELARLTGISPGTLHRELQALTEMGLLTRREVGRQVFYSADQSFPLFEDLASIMRKTAGVVDVLRAFVYGSMASGETSAASDIDIMLLSNAEFGAVVRALAPAQTTLRREVNPVVMGAAEFNRKRREKSGFIANVLQSPKLWLIGEENDLPKSAKNRPA